MAMSYICPPYRPRFDQTSTPCDIEEDGTPHKTNTTRVKNANALKCILGIFSPSRLANLKDLIDLDLCRNENRPTRITEKNMKAGSPLHFGNPAVFEPVLFSLPLSSY